MFSDSEAETAVSAGEAAEKKNEASLSVAAFAERAGCVRAVSGRGYTRTRGPTRGANNWYYQARERVHDPGYTMGQRSRDAPRTLVL